MKSTRVSTTLILITALATACGPNPGGETAGNYLDDATITTKVKAAISLDSRLSALDIRVETDKGVVQLSGFVDSQQQVAEASHVASGVAGVKSVHNSLIVRQRGTQESQSRAERLARPSGSGFAIVGLRLSRETRNLVPR